MNKSLASAPRAMVFGTGEYALLALALVVLGVFGAALYLRSASQSAFSDVSITPRRMLAPEPLGFPRAYVLRAAQCLGASPELAYAAAVSVELASPSLLLDTSMHPLPVVLVSSDGSCARRGAQNVALIPKAGILYVSDPISHAELTLEVLAPKYGDPRWRFAGRVEKAEAPDGR